MISLEEFMATEEVKSRSKLAPFKQDILILKNKGYTEASIIKYLGMNGVSVSQRGLNKFIQKNMGAAIVPKQEPKKKPEEKKLNSVSQPSKPRTFDWQTPVDEKEII